MRGRPDLVVLGRDRAAVPEVVALSAMGARAGGMAWGAVTSLLIVTAVDAAGAAAGIVIGSRGAVEVAIAARGGANRVALNRDRVSVVPG